MNFVKKISLYTITVAVAVVTPFMVSANTPDMSLLKKVVGISIVSGISDRGSSTFVLAVNDKGRSLKWMDQKSDQLMREYIMKPK